MTTTNRPALHVALWVAQLVLGLLFIGTGLWKLATPTATLATMIPWVAQVPAAFVVFIAVVDMAGGFGVILPSLTRIAPRLTVLAAIGCLLLQGAAVAFHLSRGEGASTPFNVVLIAVAAFIAWGRWRAVPIAAR